MPRLLRGAAIAGVVVMAVLSIPDLASAAGDFKDVIIRNTDAEPVPTRATGVTPVSGTVHLDSNQVEVTNPVAVGGTVAVVPALPAERFEAAIQLRFGFNSLNPCVNCDDQILYDVPDGKVAVIQHVSVSSKATEHIVPEYSISAPGEFSAGSHFIETHYVDTDERGRRVSVGSHAMTIYSPFQTDLFQNREVIARVVADVFVGHPAEYSVSATRADQRIPRRRSPGRLSPGRPFYDRKRSEGRTGRHALRALKRRLGDVIYRHLVADAARRR